jgi:UDP-GlcNAc3NAcA epimerase
MKITTIVGARPQFIKAAPVSKALYAAGIREFLVHTGQHYDHEMSQVFFTEMGIPKPDINLSAGSGTHGKQTAAILAGVEQILLTEQPDWVLVYGDTNSTLAGALAAVKLQIPIAHVESGLRSFNRSMPEEHNRVLTDHCADLLFCPTQTAVDNLAQEGLPDPRGHNPARVLWVGDTMYDAVLQFSARARESSTILKDLGLVSKDYLLVTVHRPYNSDSPESLADILAALIETGEEVVFPVHPRTRSRIEALSNLRLQSGGGRVRLIDPVGYLDMLALEQNARMILTDSGGIQKEAYFFQVPCVTLRPETEWLETVEAGWNKLTGANREQILAAVRSFGPLNSAPPDIFGDGRAAERIVATLMKERKINHT